MSIEQTILGFREYARQVLEEQTEHLKEYDKNYLLSGKLARLKFFNTHLKVLKSKLGEKTESIIIDSPVQHQKQLKKELGIVSNEYINEYLYFGFVKDNE